MLDMIWGVFRGLWALAKYPLYFIFICLSIFVILVFINIIIELIKGKRFKKRRTSYCKKA